MARPSLYQSSAFSEERDVHGKGPSPWHLRGCDRRPAYVRIFCRVHQCINLTLSASIRAYDAEETFKKETAKRIDRYVRAARSFYNLNRWISVRIDALSALFSGGLAFYLVYGGTTRDPSVIGFVLNMAGS